MITIYGPDGQSARIVASSVSVWEARGWSQVAEPAPAAPKKLRSAAASAQPSDVTPPGESRVEGADAPHSVATAQDEE